MARIDLNMEKKKEENGNCCRSFRKVGVTNEMGSRGVVTTGGGGVTGTVTVALFGEPFFIYESDGLFNNLY